MVKSDPALRRLLRDTGKLLLPYGFQGSEPRWISIGSGGVATVGRTRITRTWDRGQQVITFDLTCSATPLAWWHYRNWHDSRAGRAPTALEQATGPDLLGAAPTAGWTLRTEPDRPGHVPEAAVEAVRAELPRRVHACARRALRLVEPEAYLDELLALPEPRGRAVEAIAVLAAERGPGPRFERALDDLIRHGVCEEPDAVVAYLGERARRSSAVAAT